MIKKFLNSLNQKGQSLVFYALLVPLLFTVGGAAVDLGWYYMNFARLQNAADAAAMAGAKKIIKDEVYFKNYSDVVFVSDDNKYNQTSDKIVNSENYAQDEKLDTAINDGTNVATKYAFANLDNNKQSQDSVNFNVTLYQPPSVEETSADLAEENTQQDLSKVLVGDLYYEVQLSEKVDHLFSILENFGEMTVSANAVTRLIYKNPPPDEFDEEKRNTLKAENVISGNWEVEDAKFNGKWKPPTANLDNYFVQNALHTYDNANKVWLNYNNANDTNYYRTGDHYRYSTVEVKPGNGRLTTGGSSSNTTPDSLTFGFRQDIIRILPGALEIKDDGRAGLISGKSATETLFEKDWDIRYDTPYNRKLEIKYINGKYLNGDGNGTWWTSACDLRIHAVFNISNFDVRSDKVTEESPYDILWVLIESEAFIPLGMLGVTGSKTTSHRQFKSVRQIVLNVNQDNTVKEDGKFKYRPVVMFYDGPEKIDMKSHVRDSKPVILNLNADFRGILFAPNSPVILNDNGHKFYGFIVAKEYRQFVTNSSSGQEVVHKKVWCATHKQYHENKMYVNDYGEVLSNPVSKTRCGYYATFGIASFEDYDYELENSSQDNLFTI